MKRGPDAHHPILSGLCQTDPGAIVRYFAICFSVSTLVYGAIAWLVETDFLAALPLAAAVIYQTINFHHYVVDGVIWKVRGQPALRRELGVSE